MYGSYARGDYTLDSDVDVMILVNLSEEEIQNRYWLPVYPFYQNVEREGVKLYVA